MHIILRLLHVHLFFWLFIQKCILHIHLLQLLTFFYSHDNHYSHSFHVGNKVEYLPKISGMRLCLPFSTRRALHLLLRPSILCLTLYTYLHSIAFFSFGSGVKSHVTFSSNAAISSSIGTSHPILPTFSLEQVMSMALQNLSHVHLTMCIIDIIPQLIN